MVYAGIHYNPLTAFSMLASLFVAGCGKNLMSLMA